LCGPGRRTGISTRDRASPRRGWHLNRIARFQFSEQGCQMVHFRTKFFFFFGGGALERQLLEYFTYDHRLRLRRLELMGREIESSQGIGGRFWTKIICTKICCCPLGVV
jgi:hypothetical protein